MGLPLYDAVRVEWGGWDMSDGVIQLVPAEVNKNHTGVLSVVKVKTPAQEWATFNSLWPARPQEEKQ